MRGEGAVSGQLALMDALVFLAVAILVSSAMMGHVGDPAGDALSFSDAMPHPTVDILTVLMRASLGVQMTVDLGRELALPADTSFAECLLLEARAMLGGADEAAFGAFEARLLDVLDSLLGPSLRGHIHVSVSEDVEPPLVCIEHSPVESLQVSAASQRLSDDGVRTTAILLVEPALGLEPLRV